MFFFQLLFGLIEIFSSNCYSQGHELVPLSNWGCLTIIELNFKKSPRNVSTHVICVICVYPDEVGQVH